MKKNLSNLIIVLSSYVLFLLPSVQMYSQEIELAALNLHVNDYAFESHIDEGIELPESYKSKKLIIEKEVAKRTCFCVVSYNNLSNQKKRSGVCLDLTSRVNKTYRSKSKKNAIRCNDACTKAARALSAADKQRIANCACAANRPNGHPITAFSALSTRKYMTADAIGTLENIPAQTRTDCTCPRGWTVDTGQTDINKKCKKQLCKTEYPVPNQEIPGLGYIWDNQITQWIRGKCNTVITRAAICRLKG